MKYDDMKTLDLAIIKRDQYNCLHRDITGRWTQGQHIKLNDTMNVCIFIERLGVCDCCAAYIFNGVMFRCDDKRVVVRVSL